MKKTTRKTLEAKGWRIVGDPDQFLVPRDEPSLRAFERILNALEHAEKKHPGWPADPLRRAAIICEESGEVLQATLNMIEEQERNQMQEPLPHLQGLVLHEVAQVGAMALRYLINYERSRQ